MHQEDKRKEDNRPHFWREHPQCRAISTTTGERCKLPSRGKRLCGIHDGSNTPLPYSKERNDRQRKLWKKWVAGELTSYPPELKDFICGAKTRKGTPCKKRDLYSSGRCKLHGGLSTGPRSIEGKKRSSQNSKRSEVKQTS